MQVFDGVQQPGQVWHNLPTPALYEHAVRRHEAMISHLGPLVVRTGQYTGRSPNDKWVVEEPGSKDEVWWGDVNQAMSEDTYDHFARPPHGLPSAAGPVRPGLLFGRR